MASDRRTFFKRGLLGGALLLVGGSSILALRQGHYVDKPTRPLVVLDPAAFAILVAAIRRLTPAQGDDAIEVAVALDQALLGSSASAQKDFVRALYLLENALAGFVLRGEATPFTMLPPRLQDRALEGWRDARLTMLKGAYHAIRRLSLGTYYGLRDGDDAIGYPGPPFEKAAPPRIQARGPLSEPYVPRPPASSARLHDDAAPAPTAANGGAAAATDGGTP